MSFNKSMVSNEVPIPVTFENLYKDDTGKPLTLHFTFRLESDADSEAIQRKTALGLSQRELRLERFCLLLTAPPPEIDDFPNGGGSLAESARAYFGDPSMDHIVLGAILIYGRTVQPAELFRGI